jgi:hypothetical protein
MRIRVTIPDELFRRATAAAASRRCTVSDLVTEGLLSVTQPSGTSVKGTRTLFELMESACGIVSFGVDDLGTNQQHLADFGRDN